MTPIRLIQTCDGIERPAVGRWTIAANQFVSATPRARFRRPPAAVGRTTGGVLVVHDDSATATLALTVDSLGMGIGGDELAYAATLRTDARDGLWRADGSLTLDRRSTLADGTVRYLGVYRQGGRAAAWLRLRVRVGSFDLTADLNADAPAADAAASAAAPTPRAA